MGSGFVIHEAGYIVTNAHVVARTIERKAVFADGREYDADIVAMDKQRDLAVLRIKASSPLTPLRLGHSDDIMIGETVIAIGNPFGYQHTVTSGVVSALDRSLEVQGQSVYHHLIQTDASINPGNSGGPLLNVLGELIGVNTAIRGDAENIGFAIPVDDLRAQLRALLDFEEIRNVNMGLTVSAHQDLRVTEVAEDSPAGRAGMRPGDVLRRVAGKPLGSTIDFQIAMLATEPGDRIRFDFEREGRPMQASLVLEANPEPDGMALASRFYGLGLRALSVSEAKRLGLRRRGVIVQELDRGAPAAEVGIQAGDVLLSIGKHEVYDTEQLGPLLKDIAPGDTIYMKVYRPRERAAFQGPIKAR